MCEELKVAVIGLDTSHSIQFVKRMNDPHCEDEHRVNGLKAISCMRFESPFYDEKGQDERQKQLEEWGVKVTADFDETVEDCDALMLEINDASYHLEYFKKCSNLGKPIFLDKPLADNIGAGFEIADIVRKKELRFFSASCLRSVPELREALQAVPMPMYATVFGPLGKAPAGSSIVWYGVHAFEMLQFIMGRGATSVSVSKDDAGVIIAVKYPDQKRGVVELVEGSYVYGGSLRTKEKAHTFDVDMSRAYTSQLLEVREFFKGSKPPLEIEDTVEVMNMLDAAERSFQSGKEEKLSV